MAHTRMTVALVLAAAASLVLTPGCFFMESNIKVAVDGSADVDFQVGISEALMQGEGDAGDMLGDIRGSLTEPGWEVKALEREGYKGVALTGHVPPGGKMLPGPESKPGDMAITVERRLFSTDYRIDGKLTLSPPEDKPAPAPEASAGQGRIVFAALDGSEGGPGGLPRFPGMEGGDGAAGGEGELPFDPKMLSQMLMGGGGEGPHATLTIRAPGTVLETDGDELDGGGVQWALDIKMMQASAAPEVKVHLVTRLVNHQVVGRLADRLALELDQPDMAALIADYVSRGLLPNPPRTDALSATFDVAAYGAALNAIATLEDTLGPQVAEAVVRSLGFNADNVTAQRLHELHDAVVGAETEGLVDMAAGAVVRGLSPRGK
jgi:hypothetical protein